ncbi:hypothetical protein AJ80_00297 [Polytolypa hystricis UAMH7299]|uniref:Uncharacterized protein n=1 Tax=Polytolypa hystricis (strain UAMH7299) TaxID=1447883 RepID=A0A2B7Z4S3_POLH7|nr:hypothetical protein AJ80_00297 [Polytolypa hystricis UAMH7299]
MPRPGSISSSLWERRYAGSENSSSHDKTAAPTNPFRNSHHQHHSPTPPDTATSLYSLENTTTAVPKRPPFKPRRSSLSDAQCLSLRFSSSNNNSRENNASSSGGVAATTTASPATASRIFDFGLRTTCGRSGSRSPSRKRSTSAGPRGFLRSAFAGGSGKGKKKGGEIREGEQGEKDKDGDGSFDDKDGYTRPILEFHGSVAEWKRLDNSKRDKVYLDLFWPVTQRSGGMSMSMGMGMGLPSLKHQNNSTSSESVPDIGTTTFPLDSLRPLCNFRNLKSLKLTGMTQSYQRYIWETVWLNPELEELLLEMALEPCIRRTYSKAWPSIKGDWVAGRAEKARGSYYGENGQGTLDRRIGIGEYLDKYAIAAAKARAAPSMPPSYPFPPTSPSTTSTSPTSPSSTNHLPIVKLVLIGFVVDADPFFFWFNPHRLRVVHFKDYCVDAGFALPAAMVEKVRVCWPKKVNEYCMVARRVGKGEVRVVEAKGKKGGGV